MKEEHLTLINAVSINIYIICVKIFNFQFLNWMLSSTLFVFLCECVCVFWSLTCPSLCVAPLRHGRKLHPGRPGVCGPGCVEARAMPDLCVRQRHGDVRWGHLRGHNWLPQPRHPPRRVLRHLPRRRYYISISLSLMFCLSLFDWRYFFLYLL